MPRPLPVELLFHIVDLALSPDETISEYGECEKLLTSLFLVSRQLRDIAQSLLFRIFRLELNHLVLLHYPLLAKHVYILSPKEDVKDLGYLAEMVQYLPNLTEVRLRGCKSILTAQLSVLIEHLSLSNSTTSSFSSVVFHNLVSLTIHNVGRIGHRSAYLFPCAAFPSLEAVYTTSSNLSFIHGREFIEPRGLKKGQLDMLQVHIEQNEFFPSDLLQRGTPVLLTLDLRFAIALGGGTPLIEHVEASVTLKSLSLPSQFHPSSHLLQTELVPFRDKIFATCASRKIDIIWRLDSKEPVDDEAVSRDFWRYAKELKRKKTGEAEGGGGGSSSA
ncbi:hypothetical protein JCM8547_007021 [Rhodosporidiobolus lusitaniae]